jgi:hypothetical protein
VALEKLDGVHASGARIPTGSKEGLREQDGNGGIDVTPCDGVEEGVAALVCEGVAAYDLVASAAEVGLWTIVELGLPAQCNSSALQRAEARAGPRKMSSRSVPRKSPT